MAQSAFQAMAQMADDEPGDDGPEPDAASESDREEPGTSFPAINGFECVAKLKGSIGEGSNHSSFSHQSSVKILSKFSTFC